MMAIFKRCNTCHQLYDGYRCPVCTRKFAKKYQTENTAKKVYASRLWQKCRKNVRIKYMDYDIWLLGIGVLQRLNNPIIHHIKERDERPDLLFILDNLITVSEKSHGEIHALYRAGGVKKEYALHRIADGIAEFEKRFGDG